MRNAWSLARRETADEISTIFAAIPDHLGDSFLVVSGEHYSRARRDNLRRIWAVSQPSEVDANVDSYVLEIARSRGFRLAKHLADQCDLPRSVAMGAIYRLIGQNALMTNWDATINLHSRVWLAK